MAPINDASANRTNATSQATVVLRQEREPARPFWGRTVTLVGETRSPLGLEIPEIRPTPLHTRAARSLSVSSDADLYRSWSENGSSSSSDSASEEDGHPHLNPSQPPIP